MDFGHTILHLTSLFHVDDDIMVVICFIMMIGAHLMAYMYLLLCVIYTLLQ